MSNVIITFLNMNTDKIWTLLATFLGAFISYRVTTASEKRKEKREAQLKTLHEILIPLCCSIEKVLDVEKRYKTIEFAQLDLLIKAPFEFLKVEKRVFLSSRQKVLIEQYKNTVCDFYKRWEDDQLTVVNNYQHWISENIKACPSAPIARSVDINMDKIECQMDVLGKKECSYKRKVRGVTFFLDDKDEEYCRFASISFDENIENLYNEIEAGFRNIKDIDNNYDRMTCEVYRTLMSLDDIKELRIIMNSTRTEEKFFEVLSKANALQKCLIKDIDKITL